MSERSIDGLMLRSGGSAVGLGATVPKKMPKPAVSMSVLMGSDLKRKEVAETPEREDKDDAIREFLDSVRDDDPTNLVGEVTEREEKREEELGPVATIPTTIVAKPAKVKRQARTKKKWSVKKRVLMIVGALLLVGILAIAWLYIQGNDFISKITGGGNLWSMITADPDVPLAMDKVTGRTNVLIFGTEGYSMDDPNWDGGHLTDSMMVASIDQDSGDIRTISLPRDLKAKTCTATSKLNEVYYCNYIPKKGTVEGEQEAAGALAEQVEEILGISIQYFVHVNWQAVVQLVDSLGGIDVAVIYDGTTWTGPEVAIETNSKLGLRDYYDPATQSWLIDYSIGEVVHLDGEHALGVARSRNASGGYGSGSNFGRERFQQRIIQAVIMKAAEKNYFVDIFAAMGIKNAIGDNLRTDVKDVEIKSLFNMAQRVDMSSMKTIPIEVTEDGTRLLGTSNCGVGLNGVAYSYVCPVAGEGNYASLQAYVKRKLSPPSVETESARVVVMNASGISGIASSEGAMLKREGFNVVGTTDAPLELGEVPGVMIYQLDLGMAETRKALEELYVSTGTLTSEIPPALANESADFVMVLGAGYEGY